MKVGDIVRLKRDTKAIAMVVSIESGGMVYLYAPDSKDLFYELDEYLEKVEDK